MPPSRARGRGAGGGGREATRNWPLGTPADANPLPVPSAKLARRTWIGGVGLETATPSDPVGATRPPRTAGRRVAAGSRGHPPGGPQRRTVTPSPQCLVRWSRVSVLRGPPKKSRDTRGSIGPWSSTHSCRSGGVAGTIAGTPTPTTRVVLIAVLAANGSTPGRALPQRRPRFRARGCIRCLGLSIGFSHARPPEAMEPRRPQQWRHWCLGRVIRHTTCNGPAYCPHNHDVSGGNALTATQRSLTVRIR